MGARQQNVTYGEECVAGALVRASIAHRYEPKQFNLHLPIAYNFDPSSGDLEGDDDYRIKGFRPDFYLTEMKMYLEVGNVRHKRQKMTLMRRCFPNVRVLIVDNSWADQITQIDGEDMLNWIQEKWIEQEYATMFFVHQRVRARCLALEPNTALAPSMRVC